MERSILHERRFANRVLFVALLALALCLALFFGSVSTFLNPAAAPVVAAVLPEASSIAEAFARSNFHRRAARRPRPAPAGFAAPGQQYAGFGLSAPVVPQFPDDLALGGPQFNVGQFQPLSYTRPLLPPPPDFSPNNNQALAPVPEVSTWVSMIVGMLTIGTMLRTRRGRHPLVSRMRP